jgi:nitrate reductase NapE component
LLRNVPALDSAEVKMKVIEREGMDTAIVIVAVILPTLLVGVFGYFAYLVDGAGRERR